AALGPADRLGTRTAAGRLKSRRSRPLLGCLSARAFAPERRLPSKYLTPRECLTFLLFVLATNFTVSEKRCGAADLSLVATFPLQYTNRPILRILLGADKSRKLIGTAC